MKRLVLVISTILLMVSFVAAGCAEKEPTPTADGEEVVSSCVSCHTDKELLKEVATPEEEEVSEATSGEG